MGGVYHLSDNLETDVFAIIENDPEQEFIAYGKAIASLHGEPNARHGNIVNLDLSGFVFRRYPGVRAAEIHPSAIGFSELHKDGKAVSTGACHLNGPVLGFEFS
jgi:hypothetical protein